METVGIRELKAQLSEYLRRVQTGQHLTITAHGRPIATIAPVKRAPKLEWLHAMVAEGRASWSGGKPKGLRTKIRWRGGKPASEMVLEDRR